MIELVRIDHRLLHGQVAFSWTKTIGADCILVADDDAATNSLKMTTLRLAKPQGVKLVKNREGSRQVAQAIFLLPEEEEMLHELAGRGIELEIRQVPTEKKELYR